MSSERSSSWPAWLLLGGAVVLWFVWRQVAPVAANRRPLPVLAEAAFSDGVRVQVLEAGLGTEVSFERHTRPHLVPTMFVGSSQGYDTGTLSVRTQRADDQFKGVSVVYQSRTAALTLIFRLQGVDGKPLSTDLFFCIGELMKITRDKGMFKSATEYAGTGSAAKLGERVVERKIETTEKSGGSNRSWIERNKARGDWIIEVEDGHGGWLLMDGPIVADEEDGRAIALRYAYPRDREHLRLRFSRNDGGKEAVELQIKTPGFMPSFTPFQVESLPSTKSNADVELTLKALKMTHYKEHHTFWLTDLTARHHEGHPHECLDVKTLLEDHFGNVYPPFRDIVPLPGIKVLRVQAAVSRSSRLFPYQRAEVSQIATGIWSSDAARREVTLTENAKRQGFSSIEITEGNGLPDGQLQLPSRMKIRFQGELPLADREALERDFHMGTVCVFAGQEDRCQGEGRFASGSAWRSTQNGIATFDTSTGWSGNISEGDLFMIGIPPKQPPLTFSFDAAVPLGFTGEGGG